MSAYTTKFHDIINLLYTRDEVEEWFKDYELTDFLSSDEIDVIQSKGVWNKDKLAKKIVNAYMFREIGFETIGLFRHYVKSEMNQLMEEFLPLIYSASLKYNPLNDVDMYYDTERDTINNANTTSNGNGLSIYSDTPQGEIRKAKILDGSYATSTNANESTNTTSSNSTGDENVKKHEYGRRNTNQKLINDYRKNIIAIDKQIIERLNILFMGIYEEA